jgi:hypothetical protein
MRMLVLLVSSASLIQLAPAASADPAPSQRPGALPRGAQPATPRSTAPPAAPAAGAPAKPPTGVSTGVSIVQLPPLDLSVVPEPCKPLAKQALSPSSAVAFSARISLASCMADRAIAPLSLCDCGASILAIDTAVAPAIAVLDDVIAAGAPEEQIIAEHTEGELYTGFMTRMLATLPKVGPDAGEAEIALHDMRRQTLTVQLAPWREAALASFQHVVELAKAHPAPANNRAVATAVRDSEQRLAAEVATR